MNAARGLTNLISGGRPVSGLSEPVKFLGAAQIPVPFLGQFGAIPVSALVLLVVYGGVAFFLRKTAVGRHVVAVGGNPQAARVSGISVDRILVLVYVALRLLRRALRRCFLPAAPIPASRMPASAPSSTPSRP